MNGESFVAGLGGKKTRDVLALMRQKPADITKDTAQQGKLAKLADNIEARGGATSDDTLINFISNASIWTGIVYPGATLAAAGAGTPRAAPAPAAGAETQNQKIAKIFEGMTPDDRAALEDAKAKEVAAGTLPTSLQANDRAKKIAAKLTANGASDGSVDANQSVRDFIAAHLMDKDWTIA
jgi:hypothetical protein